MSDKLLKLEKQETKKYRKPEYYINRELSWMDFNDRVLEEARNKDNPLLDRVNFLELLKVMSMSSSWLELLHYIS